MPRFLEILERHFRLKPMPDNLPRSVREKTLDDRKSLALVMRDMGFREGLEIGTRYGESAEMWCNAMPDLHLTCIDPYEAYPVRPSQDKQDSVYHQAQERLQRFNVAFVKSRSQDVADQFEDESVDFVNIDGYHVFDAVMMDIVQYAPKVKPDGLILVHDYCPFHRAGVIQAVNAYTAAHAIDPWFVTKHREPTAFWQKGAALT